MSSGSIYDLKPAFTARLGFAVNRLAARRVSPTTVTIVAIPISLIAATALIVGAVRPAVWLSVPFLCIGVMAINAIDGRLARVTGRVSRVGGVSNEMVDRFSDLVLIASGFFLVPSALASAALLFVMLAEVVALIGWGGIGDRALVGIMGKPDRAATLSMGAAFAFFVGIDVFVFAFLFIAIGAAVTTAQRVFHVVCAARTLDQESAHAR